MSDIKLMQFTPQQEKAVISYRAAFNAQQSNMVKAYGYADGFGDEITGNAAPIPLDAWRRIDTEGKQIQRDELVIFNRLAAARTVPVAVADLVSFYPKIGNSGSANFSMDGRRKGRADSPNIVYAGTPVPVIDDEVSFGWRAMEVLRKGGGMLDTEATNNSTRVVAESIEDMVINGKSSVVIDGNTIYGLRNFPQRNTGTHSLDLNGATGVQWLGAFEDMLQSLVTDNAFGRVTVFMNYGDWLYASINEYASGYPKTILQRLQEIQQVAEIVPSVRVPVSELLGIANLATGGWGKILSAMPISTRPNMRQNPSDEYVFTTLAMVAPQFTSDYDGRSQLTHFTKA